MFNLISTIIVAAIAGWIASNLFHTDRSIGMNIVLGLIGGFIGGFLAGVLGLHAHNFIGNLLLSTLGAVLTIYIINRLS
ncbi:MAG: GlsB/YeaQ/YmgE family stress response membrane protein [Bulleidia sp.]